MNSRAIRTTVSLLLAVCLLCCSVSVSADDEPTPTPTVPPYDIDNRVVLSIDMASLYVWQILNSWGIHIEGSDWLTATEEGVAWVKQIMLDYALDLGVSAAQLIAPWLFNNDIWGNLLVNDRALNDIQDFAQWIINKYNLSDNQSIIITEETTIDGVNLYKISSMISWEHSNNRLLDFDPLYLYVAESAAPNSNTYYLSYEFAAEDRQVYNAAFVIYYYNNGYKYCIISTVPYEIDRFDNTYYGFSRWKENQTIYTNTWVSSWPAWERIGTSDWYIWGDFNASNDYQRPLGLVAFQGTREELKDFIAHSQIDGDSTIEINTTEIMLPDEDPNYTDGDSMVIIDDEPTYQIIDWDGTVNVNNLPAIVSQGEIDNPEIDQIYTNIPAFIETAGDTMNAFKQIIFRMPDEVLICLYALLAIGVIFGFLRIMREH